MSEGVLNVYFIQMQNKSERWKERMQVYYFIVKHAVVNYARK